ncbi:Non-specific serine/threonine protein kinase protein [Dioscorea alata]|uniref:Non-specific serine/threonine protein kinase protein n=1 Tax=Dioscorea alata TaxID=55571 RepID=A0ACB7UU63_DIOAL|nr:Non-specific serine/threonine protein kinase protein [Dioscorea alata]
MQVTCQPLNFLVKEYLVLIFAICIALHSSEHPEKEQRWIAVCNSLLQIGELSELEQNDLMKKHLVSKQDFSVHKGSLHSRKGKGMFIKCILIS